MYRKNYFTAFLTVALLLIGSVAVFAQTAPMRGRVELKKADGTVVPVADATIDVLRSDNEKSKFLSTKTNKNGEFGFAGFPLGGTYIVSVSAPNVRAEYLPNVRTGGEDIRITVSEGDGKRLTEEEIRVAITSIPTTGQTNQGGKLTAEQQKKEKEEYDKKVAEINAKNAKARETGELVGKLAQEGKKAFDAKDYDLAIVKYDEGYKSDPDFVGSAPVFLNNKATALELRASILYNQSNKLTDATVKIQNMNKVTKDFADALDAYNLSWGVLKNASATDINDQKVYQNNKMETLRGTKILVKKMIVTEKVDSTKTGVIKSLLEEYIAVENDKALKAEAQIALADAYRIAADADNAIIEYRKALEMSPDNPDALAGLGLSLFDAGERSNNVQQKQEGLNLMQRFAEVAPDTHKLKESVAGAVEYLKSQKLAPQKTTKKKN
jgi:tetratricopeptide (TPR) repeat protein